jgi:NAD-dependent deacetylase
MPVDKLRALIEDSNRIVFFGGAGVSTESGIPDFRSEEGIFQTKQDYGCSPETILSHTFFMKNPKVFYKFYKEKMIYKNAQPNEAHKALARLEASGKLKAVITQNIDGLHQAAGSQYVLELHGSVHRNYCMKCWKFYPLEAVTSCDGIPLCPECNNIIKPDVVLYEESLDNDTLQRSIDAIQKADMLIVGGTSLNVYPAAGLLRYFGGKNLVIINKSPTIYDRKANLCIADSIGKVLASCVD